MWGKGVIFFGGEATDEWSVLQSIPPAMLCKHLKLDSVGHTQKETKEQRGGLERRRVNSKGDGAGKGGMSKSP